MNAKQIVLYWGFALGGIDWMTRDELAEAIPPQYTEFIGKQIIEYIKNRNDRKANETTTYYAYGSNLKRGDE